MNLSRENAAYAALDNACADLINTKLILTSGKISNVLRVIASDSILVDMVSECMIGFDYEPELRNSFYKVENKARFKLPPSSKKAVALLVSMLYDFDNGMINFVEFITGSFPDVRSEDCYKNFTDNVMSAFLEHAKKLIFADKKIVIGETEKIDEHVNLVNSVLKDKTEYITKELHKLTKAYVLDEQELIRFMIDGFTYTLELKDIRLIRIAYYGLKSSLKDYKQFNAILKELESILRMYSVFSY
ncbi:MAG: hypothetical protein LBT30_01290 [Clostridiales bacterium]|jgi:hypothetical protein|nr:hypothetical protein [Clostridiales bacterium]